MSDSAARPKRATLPNGQACLLCRSRKKKCDAALPRCGRCVRYDLPCHSQVIVPRRRRLDNLQAKLHNLELQLSTLSSAPDDQEQLALALFSKVQLLGGANQPRAPCRHYAMWPYSSAPSMIEALQPTAEIYPEESEVGYRPAVPRTMMDQMVQTYSPRFDGSSLPPAFSMWMYAFSFSPYSVDDSVNARRNVLLIARIRLFLPFRLQFHFFVDPQAFLSLASLPPDHPDSIHPCLLNALYLATCWVTGRDLAHLTEHFATQTRMHMEKSLESADRLMHFLWANTVLGSYYVLIGRLEEAYVTVSSTARFALACGLDVVHYRNATSLPTQTPLLAAPANEEERLERWRLSHAIYILDRTIAMVSGHPSVFAAAPLSREKERVPGTNGYWKPPPPVRFVEVFEEDAPTCTITTLKRELEELMKEEVPLNLKLMLIHEKIEGIARRCDDLGPQSLEAHVRVLSQSLTAHALSLPSFSDTWGLEPLESVSRMNPMIIFTHVTYHGCVMFLNSLLAKNNAEARVKVVRAARALAEMCPTLRGEKGIRRVHGSVVLLLHMTNALRVFASYIMMPEIRSNPQRFAMCGESIKMLVDLLADLTSIYTSWVDILPDLRKLFPDSPDALWRSSPQSKVNLTPSAHSSIVIDGGAFFPEGSYGSSSASNASSADSPPRS